MKFAILLRLDEVLDRKELAKTFAACAEHLEKNKEVETLRFEFVEKEKKGKTKVNVMEFSLSK